MSFGNGLLYLIECIMTNRQTNPLVSMFDSYNNKNDGRSVPFQSNKLIANNVHIVNNIGNMLRSEQGHRNNDPNTDQGLGSNIIENILRASDTRYSSDGDISNSYKNKVESYKNSALKYKITNAPYKNIIKDRVISKPVEEITEQDLIVHRVIPGEDNDIKQFERDLKNKQTVFKKMDDDIKIEYSTDNYGKHRKQFSYSENFIRNLSYEEKTFGDSKKDYLEFYRKKQKEAEDGIELCDQIIKNLVDDGCISSNELPF